MSMRLSTTTINYIKNIGGKNMIDKIRKTEYLELLERKRKFLGLGVDFEKDVAELKTLKNRCTAEDNPKELEKFNKALNKLRKNINNSLDLQDENIKVSELNISIEEKNIEIANQNKEFLNKLLDKLDDLEE